MFCAAVALRYAMAAISRRIAAGTSAVSCGERFLFFRLGFFLTLVLFAHRFRSDDF